MNKSHFERETTITYDMGEQVVRIFSVIGKDQRKLAKNGVKPYKGTEKLGFFYKIPLIKFKWGIRRPRVKKLIGEIG